MHLCSSKISWDDKSFNKSHGWLLLQQIHLQSVNKPWQVVNEQTLVWNYLFIFFEHLYNDNIEVTEMIQMTFSVAVAIKPVNHRIIEWFGFEGTLQIIWFQPPCHGQGHLPLDHIAQSPIQSVLEHFQGGDIHSFSAQPVPVPHHPQSKEFRPYIWSKSTLFHLEVITLVLSPHALAKSPSPDFL